MPYTSKIKKKDVKKKPVVEAKKRVPVIYIVFIAVVVVGIAFIIIGASMSSQVSIPQMFANAFPNAVKSADNSATDDSTDATSDSTDTTDQYAAAEPAAIQAAEAAGMTTSDGTVGTGAAVQPGDQLNCYYTLMKTDGTVLQTNVGSGSPFTFTLGAGQVVSGFDAGVAGMNVGGIRTINVPASLGYADQGAQNSDGSYLVQPNEDIVFQVNVVSDDGPASSSSTSTSSTSSTTGTASATTDGTDATAADDSSSTTSTTAQ
jgi:FKBP-type peptidyl-prolyl cis-trans isomerase